MTRRLTAVITVASALVAVLVFAPPALASAHVPPWRWTSVSTSTSMQTAGETHTVTLNCPAGYRPISIEWSPGYYFGQLMPFERLGESFDFASNSASITLKSMWGADLFGSPYATVWLNCVHGDDIGPVSTASSVITHYWSSVGGTIACPANTTPLTGWANWSVTDPGARIDFSAPTATGWYATGYWATAGGSLRLGVACISTANATGVHVVTATATTGSGAYAACPAGEAVAGGGSYEAYNGTVDPARTNGTARAESYGSPKSGLSVSATDVGGSVTLSALAICAPVSSLTLTVTSAPSGLGNSANISYTFSASDPAGEDLAYQCYLLGPGVSTTVPCAPNVANTVSSLADGSYNLTIQVSNGSRQQTAPYASEFQIDTVAPNVTVSGKPADPTVQTTVSITVSATDKNGVTIHCHLDAAPEQACPTPVGYTGLTSGLHTFAWRAVDAAGNETAGSYSWRVDTDGPLVSVIGRPTSPTSAMSASFTLTASDASPPTTVHCYLDSQPDQDCPSPVSYSFLMDGLHTFHWSAVDSLGNQSTGSYSWLVDTVKPAAALTAPTALFTTARSASVTWTGSDVGSGVAAYQLRWRRAPFNGGFGAWSGPITFDAQTLSHTFTGLTPGYDYCFTVAAVDAAGNASPVSARRCTAVALDDRALTRSGGWTLLSRTGYFAGTATQTTTRNATLTKTGAQLDRLALVARKCPTCGDVAVSVDGTRVGTVHLHSATTSLATIPLPRFSYRTGTVRLKVLSSGELVQIDALAVSRT